MGGYRTLQNGDQVPELDNAITLTVYTKCPEKYILIDQETGQRYMGYSTTDTFNWRKLED
jgi:hypothetical protein